MTLRADVAVVGGGIVGLAHAYQMASRGRSVVLFERNARACGASVRNFGLLWPIGQTSGAMLDMALDSVRIWRTVLDQAQLPYRPTGSLHLAYREDERAVAQEFADLAPLHGYSCTWISSKRVLEMAPSVVPDGLLGALWSTTEVTVDPRMVAAGIPSLLASRYGVHLRFGHTVRTIQLPRVETNAEIWEVDRVLICSGDDFDTLYPGQLQQAGMVRCKLQMLRTVPQPGDWQLGPALAGGLTLRFYPSFRICSTLESLARRIATETPEYERWGIHVMASENVNREVTIGDSHEYGAQPDIFNKEEIDKAIVAYLNTFLALPDPTIAQRWYGGYAKHPSKPFVRFDAEPGVTVVTGLGGAGMTLSFGLAATLPE
jgi:FAD dependent oxidoreductase TIGR03364